MNGCFVQLCRVHILEGLGWGLATALLLGPVFFTLLRAALDHGFKGGVLVAVGIIASDILALFICATGARAVFGGVVDGQALALVGGILLFVLGLLYALRKPRNGVPKPALRKRDALGLFTSGFLVNFVNPFVFAIWTGLALHGTNAYDHPSDRAGFFTAVLIGIFLCDLLKAWLAPRLARLLSEHVMRWVYRGIAFVLILSSARLFWVAWSG